MSEQPKSEARRLPRDHGRSTDKSTVSLRQALLWGLREVGWDALSVKDLCEWANVGRTTFYAHFKGKEELLAHSFDQLGSWLMRQPDPQSVWLSLLLHIQENQDVFRALVDRRGGVVVQTQFKKLLY